ncbi:MAG: hypothetical protein JRN68_04385 [Nitrososphaerota archaeon]|nr:hypothetical protein [Nitrososphaerota archaeon]
MASLNTDLYLGFVFINLSKNVAEIIVERLGRRGYYFAMSTTRTELLSAYAMS